MLAGCSSASSKTTAPGTLPASSSNGTTGATSTTAASPTSCALSPELTAGPYYLNGALNRRDITEGKPGTPMEFRVHVLDASGCKTLEGAAVDIWHCDAGGEYSGWNGNTLAETQQLGRNDKRYLRGVQLTDRDGIATFTTIYPGWYEGRAIHIHLKVLEGGQIGDTYSGGHVAHVGQAFFDEATNAEVMAIDPYLAHTGTRTMNDEDSIFRQAGDGAIARLTKRADGSYLAEFTCTVDPTATPKPAPLF